MVQPPYSAFEPAEFDARFAAARQRLAAEGLAACLMIAPEHLYYFAGYDSWVGVNSPQALIFNPGGGDAPTLLLRDVDLPLARETSRVEDLRTYNLVTERFVDRVRECLAEIGLRGGKIGLELQSYALPAALGFELQAALPGLELVDTTQLLGDLRLVKSAAEMVCMKQAANYAGQGLRAMRENLAEDMSEIELAAAIEARMRGAGSDYWAIPTELAGGPRSAGGHATPRERKLASGDLVHAEFAGVCRRYHATAIRTLALGEPSPAARELYDIALESLEAGIAAAIPGARVAAVEQASLEPLRAHGLESAAMMRFGYGVGIAYPPIWLETLQIARGFEYRLQPGMTFVLHSCLELPDEGLGVIQGGTYLMTEGGLKPLAGAGACPLEVI
jgi:Xaa-Pro aminopeptidase